MKRAIWFTVIGSLVLSLFPAAPAGGEEASPFESLKRYDFGDDKGALKKLDTLVRESVADRAKRAAIEAKLIELLAPDTTYACKQFTCRMLRMAGSAKCVPVLAKMLRDEKLSNMARYALEANPDSSAADALRRAMNDTKGAMRIGVINSIAVRRDRKAIQSLAPLVKDKDSATAGAAIAALGKIGGKDAYQALKQAPDKTGQAATDAMLLCADAMASEGQAKLAETIYGEIRQTAACPEHCRMAALRGLLALKGDKAVPMVTELLAGKSRPEQLVAAEFVRKQRGQELTKTFAAKLKDLPPDSQVILIAALADRGDPAATPAIIQAAAHTNDAVRLAAIHALATVENADQAVELLVKLAATAKPEEREAAQRTLNQMHGKDVEANLIRQVSAADPLARVEAIHTLTTRGVRQACSAVLDAASHPDANVRIAAIEAIGAIGAAEQYPPTVKLLAQAKTAKETEAAEKSVLSLAGQIKEPDAKVAPVISLLAGTTASGKPVLMMLLAKLGGARGLETVRGATKDADPAVQDAAIRALAAWSDASPVNDLQEIAKTTAKKEQRALAIGGAVRLLNLPSNRPIEQTLELYKKTMAVAADPEEKRLVVAGLGNVVDAAALKLAQSYQADPAIKADAEKAAARIQKAMEGPPTASASHNNENAKNALDGNPDTRWDSGTPMQPGMWFIVDFRVDRAVKGIELNTQKSDKDFARGYEVYVTDNPQDPGPAVATGKGDGPMLKVKLDKPARGRYVKIVQTGKTDGWYWSIHELKIEAE